MGQNFFKDITKFKNVAISGEKEEKRLLVVGLVAPW